MTWPAGLEASGNGERSVAENARLASGVRRESYFPVKDWTLALQVLQGCVLKMWSLLNSSNENVKRNRTKYVKKYYIHHPNVPKFCSLMNMTSKSKDVKLARFI